MMADLVPAGMRGRYFGLRNKISGLTLLLAFFLGGAVLELSSNQVMLGFAILFGGATIFRLASAVFLARMHEPPARRCPEPWKPLREIRALPGTRVGRFSLYVAAMMLATYVASPFFAVYMLRELGFSYAFFVIVTASAAVANFLFMGFWGRRADKIGHLKVVRLTSYLIPVIPVLWLGGHALPYLIIIQVFSGFIWAGFNLAATNVLYEAAAPERRTRAIALYNALSGLAICGGALLGGLAAPRLPEMFGHGFLALFLLSGLLRGITVAFLLPRVEEAAAGGGQTMPVEGRLTPFFDRLSALVARLSTRSIRLSKRLFIGALRGSIVSPAGQKPPLDPSPPWPV